MPCLYAGHHAAPIPASGSRTQNSSPPVCSNPIPARQLRGQVHELFQRGRFQTDRLPARGLPPSLGPNFRPASSSFHPVSRPRTGPAGSARGTPAATAHRAAAPVPPALTACTAGAAGPRRSLPSGQPRYVQGLRVSEGAEAMLGGLAWHVVGSLLALWYCAMVPDSSTGFCACAYAVPRAVLMLRMLCCAHVSCCAAPVCRAVHVVLCPCAVLCMLCRAHMLCCACCLGRHKENQRPSPRGHSLAAQGHTQSLGKGGRITCRCGVQGPHCVLSPLPAYIQGPNATVLID